jgi:hypothetical protein
MTRLEWQKKSAGGNITIINIYSDIMKETKKNQIKQKILMILIHKRALTIEELAKESKKDPKLLAYIVEELSNEGLVNLRDITSKDASIPKDYYVYILNKGIFLINIDGGYKRINRRIRFEKAWKVLKFIVVTINALIILGIGIYSLYLTNATNELKKENKDLKEQIKQIQQH